MISSFVDGIQNTWNNIQQFFQPTQNTAENQPLLPEIQEENNNHQPLVEENNNEPIQLIEKESSNHSLEHLLALLRLEGIATIEEKVRQSHADLKVIMNKINTISKLRDKLLPSYEDGSLDYTENNEIKDLIEQVKLLEIDVPEGTVLNKTQLESLMRGLDTKYKSFETDSKLKQQEIKENMDMRTTFYELAKGIADKTDSAVKKAIHGIAGG